MNTSVKPKLLILSGGMSEEYELSITHGKEARDIMATAGFEVKQVAVTRAGEWLQEGVARAPEHILQHMDGVYIALHGKYGEDGQVQRIIERAGVPYQGSAPYQSAVGMHKMLTKEHLKSIPCKQPAHMQLSKTGVADLDASLAAIERLFGPQYIAKPMRGGSSIGNRNADGTHELRQAVKAMFEIYDDVLIEERIDGTAVTCGVIEDFRNQKRYLTPVVELRYGDTPGDVFAAEKISPAALPKDIKDTISSFTNQVHTELDLRSLSRSDFMVTDNGDVYFLEVNTLPALTKNSPLMAGLGSIGVSQAEAMCHMCGKNINQ